MQSRDEQTRETIAFVRRRWSGAPRVGVILGTGLGGFAREIEQAVAIPYRDLPHFPRSTALSHAGQLVCGHLGGVGLIAMEGRAHLYEGYTPEQITFPVEVLAGLGARALIVSNASGGLNPRLSSGDILAVTGHIDLMGRRARPSAVVNSPRGDGPYDRQLVELALEVARREQFPAVAGTYVGMSGPNYETRAEYRFLRRIGGDVVGMSTIPEVVAARRLGLRCLVLSVVTNVASPDVMVHTTAEGVVEAAHRAATRLGHIIRAAVADTASGDGTAFNPGIPPRSTPQRIG